MTNKLTDTDPVRTVEDRSTATPVQPPKFDRPTARQSGRGGLILRAAAVGAGLALIAAVGVIANTEDPAELTQSATRPVTGEQPAYLIVQNEIDASLAARSQSATPTEPRSSVQLVQDEIEAALAARGSADQTEPSAYAIIQSHIESGLAALQAAEE